MEHFKQKDGKVITTNFDTYKSPKTTNLHEMAGIIVENPDPHSLTCADVPDISRSLMLLNWLQRESRIRIYLSWRDV